MVRVSPQSFEALQLQPVLLQDLMDDFYGDSSDRNREQISIDSREVIRGMSVPELHILQMLYLDEFTTSLLVSFMDEASAFFGAVAGWGKAHSLDGVSYGYGEITYYVPEEVKSVASELNESPQTILEARFGQEVDNYRIASAGYFKDDQAILAHQRLFTGSLHRFYDEAAQANDFVLLMTV